MILQPLSGKKVTNSYQGSTSSRVLPPLSSLKTRPNTLPQPQKQKKTSPVTVSKPNNLNIFGTGFNTANFFANPLGSIMGTVAANSGNIIKELKSVDYSRVKKFFEQGVKSIPGQTKTMGGIFLSGIVSQQRAIDNFFKATDQMLLPEPLKPWNKASFEGKEIGYKKTEQIGAKLREAGIKDSKKVFEPLTKLGETKSFTQTVLDSLAFNLPTMATSTGATIATALVTKNPLLATSVGLSSSYGLGASEVYQEARNNGLDDKQSLPLSMYGGALIGFLDFLPLNRLVLRTGAVDVVKKSIIKNIAKGIVNAGTQSGFEGLTEGTQEILQNAIIASHTENKDLFKNVPIAAIVGALTGGAADVSVSGLSAFGSKSKTPEQMIDEINKQIETALSTSPEKRTTAQKKIVESIFTQEVTPDQAVQIVVDNNLEKTTEGKLLVKTAHEAKQQGNNIEIRATEDTPIASIKIVNKPIQPFTRLEDETPVTPPVKSENGDTEEVLPEKTATQKARGTDDVAQERLDDIDSQIRGPLYRGSQKGGIRDNSFYTPIKEYAESYTFGKGKVSTVQADIRKPYVTDWIPESELATLIPKLKKKGYDAIAYRTWEDPNKIMTVIPFDAKSIKEIVSEEIIETETTKRAPFSSKEAKAVQESFSSELNRATGESKTPEEAAERVEKLVDETIVKLKNDRVGLAGIRTALNKEMFGYAGISGGNYKQQYAELQVMFKDPDLGGMLQSFDAKIKQIDELIKQAKEVTKVITKTKTTKVNERKVQQPIGKGERKVSRLAAGVEAKAIEKELTENLGNLPEFQQVNMKEQSQLAAEYISENPEKAIEIAMGRRTPPANILPESIFIAVENKALNDGNIELLQQLASSVRTTEATAMGQRIRALAERNQDSAVIAMKEIIDERVKAVEKRTGKKTKDAVKDEVGKIKQRIKTPDRQDWTDFLNSIQC